MGAATVREKGEEKREEATQHNSRLFGCLSSSAARQLCLVNHTKRTKLPLPARTRTATYAKSDPTQYQPANGPAHRSPFSEVSPVL
jgi:hypothetical protein